MNITKRLLSILLVLAMILGTGFPVCAEEVAGAPETISAEPPADSASVTASASDPQAGGDWGDNIRWELSTDGTLTFSGTGDMISPSFENRLEWQDYSSSVKKVIIEPGITSICYSAFCNFSELEEVSLPEGLLLIGPEAFYDCGKLRSITIPTTLQDIGEEAFGWSGLQAIYISDLAAWCRIAFWNVEYTSPSSNPLFVTPNLYLNGTLLTDLVIPESITKIPDFAFIYCTNLRTVTLHSGVTDVGEGAFMGCSSLKYIQFQGNMPSIKNYNPFIWNGTPGSGEPISYRVYGSFEDVNAVAYYPYSADWGSEKIPADLGSGKITWIGYDPTLTIPAAPYKAVNVVSGVHVYWNAVEGTEKYGLWRSDNGPDGYYQWVANPLTNHFTDTKVESGKTYYYCVSSCDPNTNAHSMLSGPIAITYLATPDITQRLNRQPGIQLTWNQIPGATGYRIYRKSYSGTDAWVKVGEVTGNSTLTWVDASAKTPNGQMYKYTVRAVYNGTLSGCRSAGRSMMRLTSLTTSQVTRTGATSVKVSWNTTKMADGYEIRFMDGNTVVKQFTIGNYKTGVKTFTGIPAGATYKVQVRCYKKIDGMGFYSAWSEPKNVTL